MRVSSNHTRLYRDFLAISNRDFHGVIRFFEEQEPHLHLLLDEEYHVLYLAYADALFEVGAYRQHKVVVEQALFIILNAPLQETADEEKSVFAHHLLRKAASLLQCHEYKAAEVVLRQLARMVPDNKLVRHLFQKAMRKQDIQQRHYTRAVAVLLIGIAALITLVELLVVRPFYMQWVSASEWARYSVFLAGIVVLLAGELAAYWRAFRKCDEAYLAGKQVI